MKHMLQVVTLLLVMVMMAVPVQAQQKERQKGKRGQQRSAVAGLMEKLEKLNLTEEQKSKIKEIVQKYEPKLTEINQELKLTPAQRQAAAAAREKATEEGKKGKALREAADAALNLTPAQKELRAKQQKTQQEMQQAITAVLTPEQAKALRPNVRQGGDKKGKKQGGKGGGKKDK